MAFSFFPRTVKFYDLFQQQNSKLVEAGTVLIDIFRNFQGISDRCARINRLESEGNLLSREIARQLSLTFITPLDREDIHEINLAQEEVLNLIKAVSTRIGLYHLETIRPVAIELVEDLGQMLEQAGQMLLCLSRRKEVEQHSDRVRQLKADSDNQLLLALGELYEENTAGGPDALEVAKWTQIFDRIEQAIARAEDLANVIEGIALKNA